MIQSNKFITNYTPVFTANLEAYNEKTYRVIANQGSSRSSKSYSIAQLLIKIAVEEKKHISVCSPSLPHLKRGARKDILDILKATNLYSDNDFNKTDNVYKIPSTGSMIEFFGADETNKLRGPGRDILFINEANLLPREAYTQLALRTKNTIFIDFNPADEFSWVYDVSDMDGNKLIHSTYRNNKGNLTPEQIKEIESLQFADENLWRVYGLGLRGTSSETIYTHYKIIDNFPQCDDIVFGLDFGFNHPAALIKVGFKDGSCYAEELIYQSGLTNSDLSLLVKQCEGVTRSSEIFCDTSRPESIEELVRYGLNAKPAQKAVLDGIKCVKSFPLYITRNSTNLLKEIRNYKWKLDKNGKKTEEPVKFMDDACFVGETMIKTLLGDLRIDKIKIGDYVLTSKGYKKVLNIYDNGMKQVNNYSMLIGTKPVYLCSTNNHLIKCNNQWTQISQLKSGMMVYHFNSLMERFINYILVGGISLLTGITYIKLFGNFTNHHAEKAITSIILMGIVGIITLQILKRLKHQSTFLNIVRKTLKPILIGLKDFIKQGLQQHPFGIKAKRVLSGIAKMQKNNGLIKKMMLELKNYAKFVAMNFLISLFNKLVNFATTTVRLKHLEKGEGMTKQVYDLEVEDVHEYYANGILVHNCDSLRYAIYTRFFKPKKKYSDAIY